VLDAVAESGVTLEVCPGSNVALGVYADAADVPLRRIIAAGVPVALGADDPLLFGSRLLAQYSAARDLGLDDAELAGLARGSLHGSRMPQAMRRAALADVDAWLAAPA
jgi:adenosine deaminase